MIYFVDIDNTICHTYKDENDNWDYIRSQPIKYRIDIINRFYDKGNTIIYWTSRGNSTGIDWYNHTVQQLQEWGCKYHDVRLGKPTYDYWIDDKAFNDKHFFDFERADIQ